MKEAEHNLIALYELMKIVQDMSEQKRKFLIPLIRSAIKEAKNTPTFKDIMDTRS